MKSLAATALTALLLSLSACGGGTDDQAAADAIAEAMMADQGEGTAGDVIGFERAEADCVGEGLVERIGTEQLQDYGFLDEDLSGVGTLTDLEMSPADAEVATDTLFGCTDVVTKMTDGLADAQAGSGAMDKESLACVQDALTESRLRDMFTLMFSGEEEKANQAITAPMMACVTPQ